MTADRNLYRDVIECMTSGVAAFQAVRDPLSGEIVDFEWTLVNAYAEGISGWSEAQLVGKRVLEELPEHGPSGLFARFCQVVETGQPDEFILEYPSNMVRGVYDVRMVKLGGDGLAIAFSVITEQFEQRKAYQVLANRFAVATGAASIGVWEHDIESTRRHWDETTRRLFDFEDEQEVTTQGALDAVHPEDRDRMASLMVATMKAEPDSPEGAFSTRFRVIWRDASIHHIQSHARLVQAADGRRLVGVVWDVTDEVEAARELDVKRREAEAANIAKSQFLASMSHEIRTPLNGVLGMATVLEQSELDSRQRRMVETIQQSGDQLLEILNGILDLSRIESGRLEIEEKTFDLGDLLKAADALFAPQAAEKGLSFRIEAGPNARGSFISDPTRIRQILYNLLSNAFKFTHSGGIVVSADVARPAEGTGSRCELTLAVRDTGIGIPADKIERIFQPFTQADGSTTRLFGGTGLGLTIAAQLAGLLGGSITVDSTVGVGSTFTARMRLEADSKTAAEEAPRQGASPSAWSGRALIRVLVAEDNATNRFVLSEQLKAFGVEATMVENGRLAVDAWAAGRFHIILLDIHMPVMDGMDAAREIRRLEAERGCARTPIVAVTANAMPHQVEGYLAAGMDGHVAKPIKPFDLMRVFAEVLADTAEKTPRRVAGTMSA